MKHWKRVIKDLDYGSIKDLIHDIMNQLPHGSGINGKWTYTALNNGKIQLFNTYDAMNETGMYCHYYDFRITVYFKDDNTLEYERFNYVNGNKEHTCCGYDLKEYLEDTLYYGIEDYNKSIKE